MWVGGSCGTDEMRSEGRNLDFHWFTPAGNNPVEEVGYTGGASQSRVSFLLSVFHCVFKFVIYDPD